MCLICGVVPECKFCGLNCEGTCSDPDSCRSCWAGTEETCSRSYAGGIEEWDDCYESGCPCSCHDVAGELPYMPFIDADNESFEVEKHERKGLFPLMDLPREIRNQIYRIAMYQDGHNRSSPYFKGKIELNILLTCRQVYLEAHSMPLAINHIWFAAPFCAVNFFASITLKQREQIKDCSVDIHVSDLMNDGTSKFEQPLELFVKQFDSHQLKGVGVTLTGPIDTEIYDRTAHMLNPIFNFKGLNEIRVVIGSGMLSEDDKKLIKRNFKLAATPDSNTTLKRKLDNSGFSNSTNSKRLHVAPGLSVSSNTFAMASATTLVGPPTLRDDLLQRWQALEALTKCCDTAPKLVFIRLRSAREFAEDSNAAKFFAMVTWIVETLTQHHKDHEEEYKRHVEMQNTIRQIQATFTGPPVQNASMNSHFKNILMGPAVQNASMGGSVTNASKDTSATNSNNDEESGSEEVSDSAEGSDSEK